jgi:hypothetical protein
MYNMYVFIKNVCIILIRHVESTTQAL